LAQRLQTGIPRMTTPLDTTSPSPRSMTLRSKVEASADVTRDTPEQPLAPGEQVIIPAISEQLEVSTRSVEAGRVHITKHVVEREEVVSVPLASEHVRVERVAIGRTVDTMPEVRHEGDTMVIPVVEEVLVVERRLLLKEEIRVTRERVVAPSPPQRVRLRSEQVHVEREGPPGALEPMPIREPKGLSPPAPLATNQT
jgi:uncharacterized protein (TIGR02271 family)